MVLTRANECCKQEYLTSPDLECACQAGTFAIRTFLTAKSALQKRLADHLWGSFSRDRPRFTDNLDVIKFLCKDLWTIVFKKQIDNLKTNHRVWRNTSRLSYQVAD